MRRLSLSLYPWSVPPTQISMNKSRPKFRSVHVTISVTYPLTDYITFLKVFPNAVHSLAFLGTGGMTSWTCLVFFKVNLHGLSLHCPGSRRPLIVPYLARVLDSLVFMDVILRKISRHFVRSNFRRLLQDPVGSPTVWTRWINQQRWAVTTVLHL